MCDRTHEFLQLVERCNAEITSSSSASSSSNSIKKAVEIPKTKSAFHDAAAEIARGIHKTSGQLTKLTKLVRRQGLFDDPTEEINTLIYRIKQDLDELNTKCDSAQQYVDSRKRSSGVQEQSISYNVTVVSQLKSDLMNTTKDFKSVLEVRSSKMKDQQQRKVELTGHSHLSPMRQIRAGAANNDVAASGLSNAIMASPYAKMPMSSANNGEYGAGSAASFGQFQSQQLLLAPPGNAEYYESREQAVTEVEKTIGELGTLFKRLATMISEQQALVERIDEDVETAVSNSTQAHNMLLKAYESASSNRALYAKLFAIFGIFALFFIVFLM